MKLSMVRRNKKRSKEKEDENQETKQDKTVLNFQNLKERLGESEDIVFRDLVINKENDVKLKLIYIDGLVNSSEISDYVIKPLFDSRVINDVKNVDNLIDIIRDGNIYFSGQDESSNIEDVLLQITSGASVLLFDEKNIAFIFDTKGFNKRSITQPEVETVNKGAKDAFVEDYRTNTATIRKRIKVPDLMIESLVIGQRTKTTVSVIYIKSIANEEIIKSVKDKLQNLNVDNVLTTGIIEYTLSESTDCVLPQVSTTERPDKFCGDLIEGRVGVLADGLPFGYIVPGTLVQFIQTPEDYSHKCIISSFIRMIRFASLVMAILLPGFYVAITTFHFEFIPTNILLFIAKSREGVAFPVAIEAIAMLLAFEILYEAGLRIPTSIGMTVSIVGTLVVGQAAVDAKLVSPSILVVIAMTSIASFTLPNQDLVNAVRLWRIIVIIFSTLMGLVGLVLTIILFVFEMCKLTPYGVPYLSPFVGNEGKDMMKDTIFRLPFIKNKERPLALKPKDIIRRGN